MAKSKLSDLDIDEVIDHYKNRENVSKQMKELMNEGAQEEFAELAVGKSNSTGNYSASENQISQTILDKNDPKLIYKFAKNLVIEQPSPKVLPELIFNADFKFCKNWRWF